MATALEAFTLTPQTRTEHLAVVSILAGPLGPFNTPEDFEKLREKIYRDLGENAFEGLLDLTTHLPVEAERGPYEEDEITWMLSHCLATAVDGREERWARVYGLLENLATPDLTRDVAFSAIFYAILFLGSRQPIPWLENQLARKDLPAGDREDYESLMDMVSKLKDVQAPPGKSP
jgi:hypothetical protein